MEQLARANAALLNVTGVTIFLSFLKKQVK